MCLRHLLHLLKSREKVWQALGSMPLFQAGSCTSNNWLHAAAWEFSHRAWQAAGGSEGPAEQPKGRHGKVSSRRRTSSFSARKSAYMASARIYMASRISTAIVFPPSKKKKRGWKVERVGHGKVFSCRSRDQPSNHVKES